MKKAIFTLLTLSIIIISIVIIRWTVNADTSPNPDINEEQQGIDLATTTTIKGNNYCLAVCKTVEITACTVSIDNRCVSVYTDSQGNTCYIGE